MEKKGTSVFSNSLIWFGAGVSIAEILTGTYFAPLGFGKAMAAILLGHLIGGLMMFAAGMIGGREKKSAMETVKMSFGSKGSLLFAALNVLQLVGWTAIMIYDGALAANGILKTGAWVWAVVIGVLIIAWILIGLTNLGKVNTVAMLALFVLTLVLFKVIFFGANGAEALVSGDLSFGAAVELAVAMPLSWLPLISDYTREAEKPFAATISSVIVYSIVSVFMYMIGMGAAIYTGETDIAQIMVKAGFGIVGLLIIVFSTVTTTFLDAYSAGVSAVSISRKIPEKWAAVVVTIIGTIAAIVYPMDNITDFLYLIGSVFAPMIAVQIADYFILKKADAEKISFQVRNLIVWLIGFILYRALMHVDTPVGNTLPDMVITIIICLIVEKAAQAMEENNSKVNIRKLTVAALFAAVAVVGSLFSFPVFGAKCTPVQHLVNILCAVLVGPWWGLAAAFIASLIRNLLGIGTLLAFPGSMCGALLSGLLYRYLKKLPFAYVGEVFGTGIIGGMLSYPIAALLMNSDTAALFTYVVPFLISTCGGTIIAIIVTLPLKKSGLLDKMKQQLNA